MLTLTIDTSSSTGSMVIGNDGKILAKSEWSKDKSHSEKITGAMEELFKNASIEAKDLQLLVCGHGPGSFTGLRVGLSVIKSLAFSFSLPIIAIDDGFALALNAVPSQTQKPILSVIDAQKNKVFAAIYEYKTEKLLTIMPSTLLSWDELNQKLSENSYICVGDGYTTYSPFLAADILKKLQRDSKIADQPNAEKIYHYVNKNPGDFEKIDWPKLSALYLRASAAEEVLAEKLSKNK